MSMTGLCDDELIALTAQKDQQAFAVLADRYMPQALRFVAKLTGSRDLPDDIVQDVFFKIWVKAGSFKKRDGAQGNHVKAWIYRLLYNQTIDALRKNKRYVALPENYDEFFSADDHKESELHTLQYQQDVALGKAMDDLPHSQKAAVMMFYFDGLSQKDAAASMGISLSAFEALLFRARASLKTGCNRLLPEEPKV
ncbi:MAG: sigma-70 family RNA polymerase sigma factor [Alphaproteobacteria bacterium]|nr:sigma-70 family RNA polymerase sigma factor [Alphaproteobacteria bacterium]